MADIFCELLSIKEPQTMLQIKEITVQSYRKMWKPNIKKSPVVEFTPFNCTREMWMENFGYLNRSLKILWRTYTYSWTCPLPPIRVITLLAETTSLPPNERTLWLIPIFTKYGLRLRWFHVKSYGYSFFPKFVCDNTLLKGINDLMKYDMKR